MTSIKPRIVKMTFNETREVACSLANSMCENPNNIAIFKSSNKFARIKLAKMFEMVISNPNSTTFKVMINENIVGSITYTTSEFCQMKFIEIIKAFPKLLGIFGPNLIAALMWRAKWGKYDCTCRHIHLGPVAVSKDHRGKGVGKEMLEFFCNYLDEVNEVGYLETDKVENVAFYEKFGFQVVGSDTLFNNINWFMKRDFGESLK